MLVSIDGLICNHSLIQQIFTKGSMLTARCSTSFLYIRKQNRSISFVEVLCPAVFRDQEEGQFGRSRDRESRGDEVRTAGPGGSRQPLEGLQLLL